MREKENIPIGIHKIEVLDTGYKAVPDLERTIGREKLIGPYKAGNQPLRFF